ncbi:MAG: RNA methyltransferase [Flavobacteriales bacterium]|nr:RNA methyltransferase [Flavobacteriales bacterium]
MSDQADLKRVRALHQRKHRDAEGLFLVQGRKLVAELLRSPVATVEVHATAEAARDMRLNDAHVHPAHVLERMGTLETGNEVVAVARRPLAADMMPPKGNGLVIALDGVNDPGNLGTVVRIADWFGATAVWCAEGSVEAFNPKCVQASMGSIFRMPVAHGDLAGALARADREGVAVYKADMGGQSVFTTALQRPAVLVMGSESHGLSEGVRRGVGITIAIPAFGGAESLNVAAAAAALCMEFARRSGPQD